MNWTCPRCGHGNRWRWSEFDVPLPWMPIHMHCERCSVASVMYARPLSGGTLVLEPRGADKGGFER